MNENSEKLYESLVQQGLYTKSYDDFLVQFEDGKNQNLLHEALKKEGLYTKPFEDFQTQFFEKKKSGVSESEGGSSPLLGDSQPGDFSWQAAKTLSGLAQFSPFGAFAQIGGAALRGEMQGVEKGLAAEGKLQEFNRYNFGDSPVDQFAAEAELMAKQNMPNLLSSMESDEEVKLGLADIESSKYYRGTEEIAMMGNRRVTTDEDIAKQKQKFIDQQFEKRASEFARGEIKDRIFEQLTPEQREDKEFLSMLSDKIYFHAGVDVDLDGDGRYNNQPFLQDAIAAIDNSTTRITDGLLYGVSMPFLDENEEEAFVMDMNQKANAAGVNMTQTSAGTLESYRNGDIWNGTKQLMTGVAGAIPSVAVGMTGVGGAVGLGVSGGFRSYGDVAYDDSFTSEWGKIGYAVANGTGDFVFARLNHNIFKGAQASASKAFTEAGKKAARDQGKRVTMEMLRGYGYRKGLAFGTEFLEEASVELLTSYMEAVGKGQDFDFEANFDKIIEAGLIGGIVGVSVETAGNTSGRVKAAANARANANADTQRQLEKQKEALIKKLSGYASGDPRTHELYAEIARINSEVENIVKGREGFYTMMSVRHPNEFVTMQGVDQEIERLRSRAKQSGVSAEEKAVIEERLSEAVKRRLELQQRFLEEDINLTKEESDKLFSVSVGDAMSNLEIEIDGARDAIEILRDRMGTQNPPSQKAVDIAESNLSDAIQRKKDARKLIGDVEAAMSEVVRARAEAQTEGGDVTAFNDAMDTLNERQMDLINALGINESVVKGPSRFVGDILDINAQIANRGIPEWTEANIQAMETSGLSRKAIDDILQSDNFAMLTAENPNNRAVSDESNARNNAAAEQWLKSRGLNYHRIVGRYDNGENSFLVEGMTKEQAAEFARDFQQESVAHRDGLILRDGSMQVFEEGVAYDDAFDNYFSAIKDADGNIVRFSKAPSSKFVDPNGKEISKEEFDSRITDLETNMDSILESIIEEASKSEAAVPTETAIDESSQLPVGAVEVTSKRGVRIGDPGILKAKDAKDVNNLYKTLSSVFNGNVRMVIMPEGSGSFMGEGNGGLYFETKDGVPTVYVNPQQVAINAADEAAQAKAMGVKYRTKSFSETVVEEVGHALVGSSFQNLSDADQQSIYDNAIRVAQKANDGGALLTRLQAKAESYRKDGKSENIVREEVVLDLISSLAGGDANVNLSFVDSVKSLINDILVKAGFSKEMKLTDPNSIFKVASQLKAARKSGKTFSVDVNSTTKAGTKQSAAVKPFALQAGADGKVTVSMNETVYSYRGGFKKDIGNRRITKKFNDKFHFVNWWKKATNFGSDSHYSSFQTEGGLPIDMSVVNTPVKPGNMPSGNDAVDGLNTYKNRVLEAQRQGLIDSVAARRMMNLYYNAKRVYDSGDKSQEAIDRTASYMRKLNANAEAMLSQASEATGRPFDFEPDTPHGKASRAIKLDLTEKGMYSSIEEKARRLQQYYGINWDVSTKSLTRTLHSGLAKEAYGIDYQNQSEGEVTQKLTSALGGLMKSYYGSPANRVKIFSKDPVEFFERDMEQAKIDVAEVIETVGEIDSSPEGLLIAYQFIKAATSIGNKAEPNITLARQLLLESARWRQAGGDAYIDPVAISNIREGKEGAGLVMRGIPGPSRKTIADTLNKLNDAISKHYSDDGSYNFEAFLREMNQPAPSTNRQQRYKAQDVLSEKVGAFALNLNGNSDAITIDSNMGRTLLQLMGVYKDTESIFESYRHDFASLVGMTPYPVKKGATPEMFNSHDLDIIQKVGSLAIELSNSPRREDRDQAKSIERKLNRIAGDDPVIPVGFKRRRIMENAMVAVAKDMNMSNAEFSQLLFADGQVLRGGLDLGSNAYQDFASEAIRSRGFGDLPLTDVRRQFLETSIVKAVNEVDSRARIKRMNTDFLKMSSANQATPIDEAKSSKRITIPPGKIESAEDSPLYRRRSADEALLIKPDLRITDQVVSDALGTDATSRRILGKESQLSEGQQVGVRLNLNVMKKTGIPVQTLHDKTATGEALKYAAVVTVKDPVLNVNQNARRKILTFQENKFPMASVDGKFLSDKISQGNFDGVKAFFNPFKHNVFVDAQGRPIKSAGEATIVGNTVYLRGDIEYYDYNDPILTEGRVESEQQRKQRIKRGPKYDKALKRFRSYAENVLSLEFNSEEDLREAYDNMTFNSQVALNESEAASRSEEADARASARVALRRAAKGAANKYRKVGDVRSQILKDPNNYFSKQSIAKSKDRLAVMTDQELVDIMTNDALGRLQNRNDDMGVLASAELLKRAVARGDYDAIPGIVSETAAMGTSAGRLLRHFRELKNATPRGLIEVIRKEVESRGRMLSPEQDAYLNAIASELFELQGQVENLIQKGAQGEDVDFALEYKINEMKEAERKLDTFANIVIERSWANLGSTLIQGNLLTPISQATNVGANIINAIGQIGVDLVAYPVQRLINIFNKNAEDARRPSVSAYMYGVRKFGSGFIEALNEVVTGQQKDVTEWRMNRGFMPFRSIMAAIANDNLPMMIDGEPQLIDSQRVKLFVQGTLGIPAEVMFRLLSLGDTPFRRMFEGIDLYERGVSMGLEGDALKQFVKYPSKRDKQLAESRGKQITFQESTTASKVTEETMNVFKGILDKIPGISGEFVMRTLVPYRSTPANILMETLTFISPPVALARAYNKIAEGDSRAASQNIGKAVIGGIASQAAMTLIREGLLSGPIDFGDDEEKNLMYDQFPPNSINVTGLQRLMRGEDPSKQPDDYFVSYNKLGIIGAIFGGVAKANTREDLLKRDDESTVMNVIKDAFGLKAVSSISYMMDQSFLQGINGVLSTLSAADEASLEYEFERLFRTMWQATTATVLPNTLSALYRSHREYLPDTRATKDMDMGERMLKNMQTTILDRTFGLGSVPVRVNWKGEPIKQTPRGANAYMYQLFDITKARQGEADQVSNEIYRLYESTEEITKAVGTPRFASTTSISIPDVATRRDIYMAKRSGAYFSWMEDEEFVSENIRLNTEQLNRMMTVVGKARYQDLEKLINSREYSRMSDEQKVEAMNELNRDYSRAWAYSGNRLAPHTIELCKIINEIYEREKAED